ncbi:MAG: hypothetical protein WCS99_01110 [Limisphaerales bacterium]
MNTKKLLVPFDESKPESGKSDFLAVVFDGTNPFFFGLRSRRFFTSGRVVYLGREITENDVFAKLVDSGRKIQDVDRTLKTLAAYVQQLGTFKIDNILKIAPKDSEPFFELVKVAEMPKIEAKKLP